MTHKFIVAVKRGYQSQQTKHAIKTGLAAIITVIIYQLFNLPKGYWAVITAVIIMQSNMDSGSFEVTLRLAFQRLLGTVSGAIAGFGLLFLFNPNYWQLLVIIFICILVGSYLTTLYKGLALSAPTAVIILLLAHQTPITQSLAAMRTIEILLGVIVAILVTIFIWPYRITDHLKNNRHKRLILFRQQFSGLISINGDKSPATEWNKKQNELITMVKDERKYVSITKKELKSEEQNKLRIELQLVKSLTRLGETLPKLPQGYWQFKLLQSSTQSLLATIITTLTALEGKKGSVNHAADIEKNANKYLKAFTAFRLSYKQSQNSSFSIEEIYKMFTVYQSLQECAEMTGFLLEV